MPIEKSEVENLIAENNQQLLISLNAGKADYNDMLNKLWTERNGGGGGSGTTKISAYNNATQTIGSSTQVAFNTENYDTNGEFSASTFVAKSAGYYHISVYLENAGGTMSVGDLWEMAIQKNSDYIAYDQTIIANLSNNTSLKINLDIKLSAGDTIKVYADVGGGHTVVIGANQILNCISIHSI